MKHFGTKLIILLLFCSASVSYGAKYLSITAEFVGSPNVVTLQDLNLLSPSGTQLFFANLSFSSDVPNEEIQVVLLIEINGELEDGTVERIGEGQTEIFTLTAGVPKNITNVNLRSELKIDRFEISGDAILNKILATGTLPDGKFSFKLTLKPANIESDVEQITETISINIDNPTTIELIFPGRPATEGEQNLPDVSSTNPIFIWQGESANPFKITLAKRDIADQDPETAISSAQKRWIVEKNGTSVSYTTGELVQPGSSFFPLENGVYFWQVETNFQASGGNSETIKSEIFGFKFTQLTGQTDAVTVPIELQMAIRSLFEKLELPSDIINKFGDGTYVPMGYPKYNGTNMTAAGLRALLNLIESGELELVRIENN